jgi:hypothetical protein
LYYAEELAFAISSTFSFQLIADIFADIEPIIAEITPLLAD